MKKLLLMMLAITFCGTVGNAKVNVTNNKADASDEAEAVDLGLSVKWASMNVGANGVKPSQKSSTRGPRTPGARETLSI